jgi:hypothetical protein
MTPHSISIKKTLSRHQSYNILINKETSLYIFQKGTLTVEAAVAIPLIAMVLVCVLFFLRIIQVQAAVDEALFYAGRKVAVESSITDSDAALFLSAKLYTLQILEEYECIEDYVEYKSLGISLLNSDFSGEDILLRAEYSMKLPVDFFGWGKIDFWQQNTFKKWTGDGVVEAGEYVYVSKSGEVYHKSINCRSIDLSVQQTSYHQIESLRGLDGQKYYACTKCVKKLSPTDKVYYTEYGTLYHGDISCSALRRTVNKIPISDVGDRRKCSYCY